MYVSCTSPARPLNGPGQVDSPSIELRSKKLVNSNFLVAEVAEETRPLESPKGPHLAGPVNPVVASTPW